uniref:Uncharacterized protein n=1 Tax=Daphnia galeata TaxID=27404 RepID=A0A8J2WL23_9CRUS|nr:unnamed protein product [Daphnia galeata]
MGVDCWNTFVVSKPAYSTVIMPGEINRRPGHERKTKFIRIFTVMTYICSVSIAAALLSLYYFFIWDPTTNNQNSTLVTVCPITRLTFSNCRILRVVALMPPILFFGHFLMATAVLAATPLRVASIKELTCS